MNIKKLYFKILLLLLVTTFYADGIFSQNPRMFEYSWENPYKFSSKKANEITNYQYLYPFFEKLNARWNFNDTTSKIPIVHIGDSHVQAGFITAALRNLFQQYFGNAGRGLVVPLKMSRTNEPPDYKIFSVNNWACSRCTKPNTVAIGLGGLGLENADSLASICVETFQPETSFSEATVFYNHYQASLLVEETILRRDSLSPFAEKIYLRNPTNQMNFCFESSQGNRILFFGLNLEKENGGILYHSIGINGAQYENYTIENFFTQQLSVLEPKLCVISLGTNEAYGKNFNQEEFYKQIDRTINLLQKYNPKTCFLLTTPAETFIRSRKTKIPNPKSKLVTETIIKYAVDHNMAYWDLFAITGGKNSAGQWRQHKLMAKDGIHFVKAGYEYQGKLLFEAFAKAFNNYIISLPDVQH